MAQTQTQNQAKAATAGRTGKPLIESDRVEGTTVYDPRGNEIGSIKRLMIDKLSGRVAYAVMSFGGFLGMGAEEHSIPWGKLTYDTNLGGFRPTSPANSCKGRRRSLVIRRTIGATAGTNRSCTTITGFPITGELTSARRRARHAFCSAATQAEPALQDAHKTLGKSGHLTSHRSCS